MIKWSFDHNFDHNGVKSMAKPRIFISSTFYDLKQVRYDLEGFIKDMGYDPIMNDRGNIPYASDQALQDSCYDEVQRCDILVGIIGNKYGSSSNEEDYSVSMKEIKTAIKNNKQVFIFVDKTVLNENKLYMANKEKTDITYVAVDNINIHKFIEEIKGLSINNAMIPFESSNDITGYLREQFAGLFQRLLQEKASVTEKTTYYDLKEMSNELKKIIMVLDENSSNISDIFNGSLFAQRYIARKIFEYIGLKKARVLVSNKSALDEILSNMNFSPIADVNDIYKYSKVTKDFEYILKINKNAFEEDGTIKNVKFKDVDDYINFESKTTLYDEDLPF